MLIRVADLHLRKLEFNHDFRPGAIEFGPDFRQDDVGGVRPLN